MHKFSPGDETANCLEFEVRIREKEEEEEKK